MIGHLLLEGYLKEDFHFTPFSTISYLIPGAKSSRVESSQDHPIVLKTADPKGRKSTDAMSKVNGVESKKAKTSPDVSVAGSSTSRTSKLSRAKKEKRSEVTVIDLSDDSDEDEEEAIKKRRKLLATKKSSGNKKKVAKHLERNDEGDGGILVDDEDGAMQAALLESMSPSSRKPATHQLDAQRTKKTDCGATGAGVSPHSSKTPRPKQDLVTKDPANSKCSSVLGGKRKNYDCHDGTGRKNDDGETRPKKHKLDTTKTSVSAIKKKGKLDNTKPKDRTRITTPSKKTKHPNVVNPTTKLSLSNSSSAGQSTSSPVLNGSNNSGDELEEIQTVYSEQLASLELATSAADKSDSEGDFRMESKHPPKKLRNKGRGSKVDESKSGGIKKKKSAGDESVPSFSLSFDNSIDNAEDADEGVVDDIEGVYRKQMKRLHDEDDKEG